MRYLVCILFVMLSACKTLKPPAPPVTYTYPPPAAAPVVAPAPAPVPASMPAPVHTDSRAPHIYTLLARATLMPNQSMAGEPVNFLFLPSKPTTKKQQDQFEFACEQWKATFPSMVEIPVDTISDPNVLIVPLYWLVRKGDDTQSCTDLVKNYDYARAQSFASRHKIDPNKLQLICKLNKGFISMNISKMTKQSDMELAMNVWRTKMSKMPPPGTTIHALDLYTSAKEVLGALGTLLAMK